VAQVYVSSTFSDLEDYRAAVAATLRQLRHTAIAMEDYVAADARPVDACLGDVGRCDIYIGIFAWRYGYVPPEGNPERRSITELEYRHAIATGKPRLIFILDQAVAWPPPLLDSHTGDGDAGARIGDLRAELERERLVSHFSGPDELARQVSVAVQAALGHRVGDTPHAIARLAAERYTDFMKRFAAARSEADAIARYVPLLVRERGAGNEWRPGQRTRGEWSELVTYPDTALLVGPAGAGKTTLLQYEARRMAASAISDHRSPLPLYVALSAFEGGDADVLLELAAAENRLSFDRLRDDWRTGQPSYALLLDDADECSATADLAAAVAALTNSRGSHTVVVSCRPGSVRNRLRAAAPSLRELTLMPPAAAQLDEYLARYGAGSLAPIVRRLELILSPTPDLLAALASSGRVVPTDDHVPDTAGAIYRVHAMHLLDLHAGTYHPRYVMAPVLEWLSLRMLSSGTAELHEDDSLLAAVAREAERFHQRYRRRRRIMPSDWTAEELVAELVATRVVERSSSRPDRLRFAKAHHRDTFAAAGLVAMAAHPERVRSLLLAADTERWAGTLAALLDLSPDSASVFWDALPDPLAPTATQVWIEHRPVDAAAPPTLAEAFEERVSAAGRRGSPGNGSARPRLLHIKEPLLRVQATAALAEDEQWDAMIGAATDDDELVRAVARYAFVHAGAADPEDDARAPARALLSYDPPSVVIDVQGSGTIRLGSIHPITVPMPSANHVHISIAHLDEDLLANPVCVDPIPLTPALLASRLFTVSGAVDWVDLAVRCHRIADSAAAIAELTVAKPETDDIAAMSRARAQRFADFGAVLMRDLGLSAQEIRLGANDRNLEVAEAELQALRSRFSRAHEGQWLDVPVRDPDDERATNVKGEVTVSRLEGHAIGIHVQAMTFTGDENDLPEALTTLGFEQSISEIRGGQATGLLLERVKGDSAVIPRALFRGTLSIASAEKARIDGVQVRRFEPGAVPWQSDIRVSVARASATVLRGIAVDVIGHDTVE